VRWAVQHGTPCAALLDPAHAQRRDWRRDDDASGSRTVTSLTCSTLGVDSLSAAAPASRRQCRAAATAASAARRPQCRATDRVGRPERQDACGSEEQRGRVARPTGGASTAASPAVAGREGEHCCSSPLRALPLFVQCLSDTYVHAVGQQLDTARTSRKQALYANIPHQHRCYGPAPCGTASGRVGPGPSPPARRPQWATVADDRARRRRTADRACILLRAL
jgi:ferredoxin